MKQGIYKPGQTVIRVEFTIDDHIGQGVGPKIMMFETTSVNDKSISITRVGKPRISWEIPHNAIGTIRENNGTVEVYATNKLLLRAEKAILKYVAEKLEKEIASLELKKKLLVVAKGNPDWIVV